jgi:SAM-dependent methyltransferase
LPDDLKEFDVAVSGLVLNFIPDVGKALSEMITALKPGATVAAYVWDYAGKVEFMRYFWDAASYLYPEAKQLDEGRRFPICQPEALASLFEARLSEVAVTGITVTTLFRDFRDYWDPFLGGQGPAPGYAMSLSAEQRDRLRDLIQERLPLAGDGSIELQARAWAVRGRHR